MNIINITLLLIGMVLVSNVASSKIILLEGDVEVVSLNVLITKDNKGYVSGASCKLCKIKRFIVDSTVIYEIDNKPVDLQMLNRLRGKPATFFYDIKTKKLLRVTGW